MSGQGESFIFPDIAREEPIMSHMDCVFKNFSTLEMVLRDVGTSKRAKSDNSGSSCAHRTVTTRYNGRSQNWKQRKSMIDEGLAKIAESPGNPVGIQLFLLNLEEDRSKRRSQQRSKRLSIDFLGSIMEQQLVRRSDLTDKEGDMNLLRVMQERCKT